VIKININKIKNNVIKKGFPELSDEDIQIEWNDIKDSCFVLVPFKSEGYCIEIDNSMRKASVMVIEGGLAHEFAHIIDDIDKSKNIDLGRISKKYRIYQERNTDLTVILRGYGKQLLKFLYYVEKLGFPRYKEDGLSIVEIEKLFDRIEIP
jgi:hypothetical protein